MEKQALCQISVRKYDLNMRFRKVIKYVPFSTENQFFKQLSPLIPLGSFRIICRLQERTTSTTCGKTLYELMQ